MSMCTSVELACPQSPIVRPLKLRNNLIGEDELRLPQPLAQPISSYQCHDLKKRTIMSFLKSKKLN